VSSDNQQDIDYAVQAIKDRFLNENFDRNRPRNNFGQRDFSNERNNSQNRGGFSQNRMQHNNNNDQAWDNQFDNNNRQNSNVKRPINNDWDESEVQKSAPAPQAMKDEKIDDWEESELKITQNQPSMNVYSSSNGDNKPSGGFEKKFRPRENNQSGNRIPFRNYTESSSTTAASNNEPYEPIDWDKINAEAEIARKARWAKCPLMLKDFYNEHPATKSMPQEEVDKFRFENNKITVSRVFDESADPTTMPKPITKFEYAFKAWPDIMNEITKNGFDKPSPIQSQMWPILLKGEDCIGIAQTGQYFD
jgi:hypothetical protein